MTLQTMYIEHDPTPAQPATPAQAERRKHFALTLCEGAQNASSWRMANRMAWAWLDCGCEALGVRMPDDRITG